MTGISFWYRANRQRVILIVHLCLNAIALLYFSSHLGGFIGMQTYFFAALHLDEIVPIFDANQFARDRLGAFRGATFHLTVCLLIIIRLIALPSRLRVSLHHV